MSNIGWFHVSVAVISIVAGAYILLATKKGTRLHRQAGWVFVVSMLLANGTALSIYRLFHGFGPFHFFAIINLASITAATLAAIGARKARLAKDRPRREKLVAAHYKSMSWTYAGLMAAFASEAITRLPATRPGPGGSGFWFGLSVMFATLGVMAFAGWLINRRAIPSLAPFKGMP
jgi:uncharacterized membrane protein